MFKNVNQEFDFLGKNIHANQIEYLILNKPERINARSCSPCLHQNLKC